MPACPVCASRKILRELLILGGVNRHLFNIEKAKQIVQDGRVAYLVPKPLLIRLLRMNGKWSSFHLPHVQKKRPGICIRLMGGLFLVDGVHRGRLSVNQGFPFYAHLLTFQETQSCLIDESPHDHHAFTQEIRQNLQFNPGADIVAELAGPQKRLETAMRAGLSVEDNLRTKLVFYSKL